MDNFEDDTFKIDFATGVKKEKPRELYNILETTIDNMGIIEPDIKPAPVKQVNLADTSPIPDMAKPADFTETYDAIGNLFMEQGHKELQNRQKEFERQQRSNRTFGFSNTSFNSQDNQGDFMRTSGNATPAASSTNAGAVTDFTVPAAINTFNDVGMDIGQGAMTGGAVKQASRPAPRPLAETPQVTSQQTPVTPQATTTARIPGINLSPMQIDRATYIHNRLLADGFTPEQASGIVGNLIEESQLDHTAVYPGGGTFGIAQWRRPRIDDYESVIGPRSETTFEKQVDFLIHELNDKERSASRRIRNARTVDEAAYLTRRWFERPDPNDPHDDRRQRYSQEAHRLYQHNQRNRQ